MTKNLLFIACLLFAASCYFMAGRHKEDTAELSYRLYVHYINRLMASAEVMQQIVRQTDDEKAVQESFKKARLIYKKIEPIAEYYNPTTARSINGPAIPEAEIYDAKVLPPQGFQVIEELIFPYDKSQKNELIEQVNALVVNIKHLKYTAESNTFTDAHLWDALRLQLFRMAAMGIAGFDSPVAFLSIEEAAASLEGIKEFVSIYTKQEALMKKLDSAILFLQQNPDFETFDRFHFIKNHLNPLGQQMLAAQNALAIPVFDKENRIFYAQAAHLFHYEYLNPEFFKPAASVAGTPELLNLGKALFYDPQLGGNNSRNCASCHRPDKAFTDGLAKSRAFNGKDFISRNAPTLWNATFQATQFLDGRAVFMEDQIRDVLAAPNEMHSSVEEVVKKINASPAYREQFAKAFGRAADAPVSEQEFLNALAAYLHSLVALNSRFDRHMRGEGELLTKEEIHGFNLFMGKAKCGTCHFMPFFNGLVPPHFIHTESEVIGTPAQPDTIHAKIDDDLGKYRLHQFDIFKFSFKTSTVRNTALTAPYMHNGVYQTLDEVIDFYNRGGAAGIGIQLENQTLPPDPLNLTAAEKKALIAFMHSLTDTVRTAYISSKQVVQ
ncbi:cytochrome c peroxidase [Rhodoflexus caldus]|uniref:cytochrome c peroxidase n=1 Tax=Rhodoflexus caldus TaxID=2891236 RepID=UPI00202AB516|nr:cytochrome c peroxidase [Rhodoflexus caldus]